MLNRSYLHPIVGMIFKLAFRIPMRTVWQQWDCTSGWDHKLTREIITPVQVRPRTTTQPGGRGNWRGWAQKNSWHFQHQTIIAGAWIPKLIDYVVNKAGQHCWSIHIPSMRIIFRCTSSLRLDYTAVSYDVYTRDSIYMYAFHINIGDLEL